jgi:hypothetical protein
VDGFCTPVAYGLNLGAKRQFQLDRSVSSACPNANPTKNGLYGCLFLDEDVDIAGLDCWIIEAAAFVADDGFQPETKIIRRRYHTNLIHFIPAHGRCDQVEG